MGRIPCCDKIGLKKGVWTQEEDHILLSYIQKNGPGKWRTLPKHAGLSRCGKSCRFRWTNYLKPDVKRGNYSKEEEDIIIELHRQLGNRWSKIAAKLPGRTDNEIKNVWNSKLRKRVLARQETRTNPRSCVRPNATNITTIPRSPGHIPSNMEYHVHPQHHDDSGINANQSFEQSNFIVDGYSHNYIPRSSGNISSNVEYHVYPQPHHDDSGINANQYFQQSNTTDGYSCVKTTVEKMSDIFELSQLLEAESAIRFMQPDYDRLIVPGAFDGLDEFHSSQFIDTGIQAACSHVMDPLAAFWSIS